jgi:DnaJ homolog subfamily B member 4
MQVLSDPLKRSIYNEYGEDGLKGHMASSPQPGQNGQDQGRFRPRSAEDIFAEFFGSQNFDFGPMWHSSSVKFPSYGGGGGSNMNSSGASCQNRPKYRSFDGGGSSGGTPNYPARKASPVENKLLCSLEELYTGSTRKMKISRKGIDPSTRYVICQ